MAWAAVFVLDPREKAICLKQGVSERAFICMVNYNGDTNGKTVKVTLSSVAQPHSLSAGSQADKDRGS